MSAIHWWACMTRKHASVAESSWSSMASVVVNTNTLPILFLGTVAILRAALYAQLFELANRWNRIMGIDVSYPAEHKEYY